MAEHHIPNGEIFFASNLTKQWARVNFEVPIHPGSGVAKAIEIMNTIGAEIAGDSKWKEFVIKSSRAPGVARYEKSGDPDESAWPREGGEAVRPVVCASHPDYSSALRAVKLAQQLSPSRKKIAGFV